ncbi:hypothetical protein MtrunA17_Chr1g0192951 [Medicago truncatula]|uniref:Uncharacterized protein n=1 Tax=Medicago truncatula TaxID=3880 RepID=A0A072VMP4_MEDTR|nr:hypothetical protein MTR_1g084220 [Medicago truncatula]RHN80875.1 hypothetical protein MtrunA17_Chr1g0192951 [Medicago truncatula]
MDRKKNSGDFFSCGLYEATGDSEADICDPYINMDCDIARSVYDDDNDDAMSCSNDGSAVNEHDHSWCDDDDEKRLEDDEEEKDVVYGTSYCSEDDDDDDDEKNEIHNQQKKKKWYVSFDLGHESMDEMEKNRRFWEACLAS